MEIKVPLYNIVNIFLPGLVLIGSSVLLFLNDVKEFVKMVTSLGSTGLEVIVTVFLFAAAYEVGFIIFRLGAAAIGPMLKKMFGWSDDFITAGKTSARAYDKLEMLSREYGYTRTHITLYILLAILTGTREQWWLMGCCIICVALFVLTAREHMKKIQEAVSVYLNATNSEPEASGGV